MICQKSRLKKKNNFFWSESLFEQQILKLKNNNYKYLIFIKIINHINFKYQQHQLELIIENSSYQMQFVHIFMPNLASKNS